MPETNYTVKVWTFVTTFLCRQEMGVINLPVIAAPRRGSHLAACCIIQQAKCGFKNQHYPCPWPELWRKWLGLFSSMCIKGLISYIRLNFTLGIFSMGFLAKHICCQTNTCNFKTGNRDFFVVYNLWWETHSWHELSWSCWSKKDYSDSKNQSISANLLVLTFEVLKLAFAADTLWSNGYFLKSVKCVFFFFFLFFPLHLLLC